VEHDDPAFAPIAGLAALARSGRLSLRELVGICFERIERFEPTLNAFPAVLPERALAHRRPPVA
jgi:Asp-tRNA(Asn)/Glu-tRNA(Gln) amidotransferase A subunit family amidase